jgi:asparagine synthase (glutamine-hydrolysing)
MCGISGIFHFDRQQPVDGYALRSMRDSIRHRGPDDTGEYVNGRVGLGFNRLSIIDLSGGHQPMCNEDGTTWIVFNGEIYNYRDLRSELASRGHKFQTSSDTETIIHAWEEYGEDCVLKLRGMFAFAIWDARREVMFCARDRLGIKPFYYSADHARFAFASEIKSLIQLPGLSCEVDPAAVGEFLARRYVVAPNTMLRGVRKLEPGHAILVTADGYQVTRYWEVRFTPEARISEIEALKRLDHLLQQCVRMHLIADVPVGAFLSGGLDSSCVVALMARLGTIVKTFSIGYNSSESELRYARIVADHFHTEHHELFLDPFTFREVLPKIVWQMDEPVGDVAAIPLYFLAEFARRSVTVALSGEGSDEIFAGYQVYTRMLDFENYNRLPFARILGKFTSRCAPDNKLRKYIEMLGQPLERRYGGVGGLFSRRQAASLSPIEETPLDGVLDAYRRCERLDALDRMSYVDTTTWLPDDLLVKADRMTMANSLELRVPFLDHELVEFATSLPASLKLNRRRGKYLLRKWCEPVLPSTILNRPKAGFPVPVKHWFRSELSGYAREILFSADGASRHFFSATALKELLRAHKREDRSDQIYSLLAFDSWYRQFVKAPATTPLTCLV